MTYRDATQYVLASPLNVKVALVGIALVRNEDQDR